MKKVDESEIKAYHFGNGLGVYRNDEQESIAHISPTRHITIHRPVTGKEREKIKYIADTDDRCISATQEQKVFSIPPKIKIVK